MNVENLADLPKCLLSALQQCGYGADPYSVVDPGVVDRGRAPYKGSCSESPDDGASKEPDPGDVPAEGTGRHVQHVLRHGHRHAGENRDDRRAQNPGCEGRKSHGERQISGLKFHDEPSKA